MTERIIERGTASKNGTGRVAAATTIVSDPRGGMQAIADPVIWDDLETFARSKVQEMLQEVLEQEVAELLGRAKSKRREAVDGGYRNGHGKLRRLSTTIGTITVRRPRVRGLDERFVSRVLPLFARRTREVGDLLPELYLHGLAEGDFEMALRGLLGEGAPLSASSIARLKDRWEAEFQIWKERSFRDREVVYLWVDGIYVKAGLEKEKAALLVAIGALRDGSKVVLTKVVLTIESGYRESTESWSRLLRHLKERGMNAPKVIVGDGALGIGGAVRSIFPETQEQRCWNHRIVNLLDLVTKKEQPKARTLLCAIPYAATREEAEKQKQGFQKWAQEKGFTSAAARIDDDWERMVTFYALPKDHWKHLRTTNIVESPFASVRLRTTAAKRYKKVDRATVVIWRLLMVAEGRFRKLNAPELLKEIAEGATYVNGVRVRSTVQVADKKAA